MSEKKEALQESCTKDEVMQSAQWEYLRLPVAGTGATELARLGKEQWEIISIVPIDGVRSYMLKRRKDTRQDPIIEIRREYMDQLKHRAEHVRAAGQAILDWCEPIYAYMESTEATPENEATNEG